MDTSSPGVPTTAAIQQWRDTVDPNLKSFMCTGGVVGPIVNLSPIKSGPQLLAYQEQICARGVSAVDRFDFYRVHSASRFVSIQIPFNIAACSSDLATLMDPRTANGLNTFTILYATMEFFIDGFNSRMIQIADLPRQILGDLPNGITYEMVPWYQTDQGATGKCFNAYFASYTKRKSSQKNYGMIPIYSLTLESVTSTIDVSVNGGPKQTVQGTNNNAFESLLPNGIVHLLGNPYESWTGAEMFYNLAPNQIVVSPIPEQRCGSVSYQAVDDPELGGLQNWTSLNGGIKFSHRCAYNDPGFYAQPIDPQTRQCLAGVGGALAGNGGWCNFLAHFNPFPDQLTKTITFTGDDDAPIGEAILPFGTLTAITG
jgi:hypothetical protein